MSDFSRQSVHKQEVLASKRTRDTPFPIGEKCTTSITTFYGNACDLVAEEEEKVVGVRVAKERQR